MILTECPLCGGKLYMANNSATICVKYDQPEFVIWNYGVGPIFQTNICNVICYFPMPRNADAYQYRSHSNIFIDGKFIKTVHNISFDEYIKLSQKFDSMKAFL